MIFPFLGKHIAQFHSLNVVVLVSTLFVIILIVSNFPGTEGHISSILGSGTFNGRKRIQVGKHFIFCDYGPEEDGSPPLLSHIRVSRGPSLPSVSEEDLNIARLHTVKSPSLQHKLLRHLTLFPDGYVARMGSRSRSNIAAANDINMDSRPNLPTKVKTIPVTQTNDYENDGVVDYENDNDNPNTGDPEFIPYISARVLSNVPRFIEHMKENLKALHQSQQSDAVAPQRDNLFADYISNKGKLGRKKHNESSKEDSHEANSVGLDDPAFLRKANNYNPAWLLTNLGLGKRGR